MSTPCLQTEYSKKEQQCVVLACRDGAASSAHDAASSAHGAAHSSCGAASSAHGLAHSSCGAASSAHGLAHSGCGAVMVQQAGRLVRTLRCAAGSTALDVARRFCEAGCHCVLALGFEKMNGHLQAMFDDREHPSARHLVPLPHARALCVSRVVILCLFVCLFVSFSQSLFVSFSLTCWNAEYSSLALTVHTHTHYHLYLLL